MIRRSFIARLLAAVCGACGLWKGETAEQPVEVRRDVPGWSGSGRVPLPNGWVVDVEILDGKLKTK